jgi:hypothetical protein
LTKEEKRKVVKKTMDKRVLELAMILLCEVVSYYGYVVGT